MKAFTLMTGGEYYRSVWEFEVFDYIGCYQGPVLIMHGDKDDMVDHYYGRRGAECYEHAQFVTLPGEIHGFYGKGKKKAIQMSFDFFESRH